MAAHLGRVPAEAVAEMATDPGPNRRLRRQAMPWLMLAFLREA